LWCDLRERTLVTAKEKEGLDGIRRIKVVGGIRCIEDGWVWLESERETDGWVW
jgi:hypothetical protein